MGQGITLGALQATAARALSGCMHFGSGRTNRTMGLLLVDFLYQKESRICDSLRSFGAHQKLH